MRNVNKLNKLILASFIIMLTSTGAMTQMGCGSNASDDATDTVAGNVSISATITEPISASISSSGLMMQAATTASSAQAITTATAAGVEVHVEDLAGTDLGITGTTADDGTVTLAGLTEAQVDAGIVIVADTGTNFIHSYYQQDEAAAAIDVAAGTIPTTEVTPATDFAMAVMEAECTDLTDCGEVDLPALNDVTISLAEQSTDLTSDDSSKDVAAAFLAHETAMINNTAETPAADVTKAALEGDSTGIVTLVGTTVGTEAVSVADSFTNVPTVISTIKDAYCTKETDGTIPLDDVITNAGSDIDRATAIFATLGVVTSMKVGEMAKMGGEDFRNFANNLHQIPNAFSLLGSNKMVMQTFKEQILSGSFTDAAKAGSAFAMGFSTFPFKTPGDATSGFDSTFTSFDPQAAAKAAMFTMSELTNKGTSFDPTAIFKANNGLCGDPNAMRAIAMGGSAIISSFMTAQFTALSAGTTFDPSTYKTTWPKPMGGACTADSDCTPNAKCSAKSCTALSYTDGAECTTNADCNAASEFCGGGDGRKFCMFSGAIPKNMPVFNSATGPSMIFGTDVTVAQGAAGATCSSTSACASGYTCSVTTGTGMCYKAADFKFGPGAPCTADSQCYTSKCSQSICVMDSTTYATFTATPSATSGFSAPKQVGELCSMGRDCMSYNCNPSSHTCDTAALAITYGTANNSLKSDGASCTAPHECTSFNCVAGKCTAFIGTSATAGSTGTAQLDFFAAGVRKSGEACHMTFECASPLQCNAGTCGSAPVTTTATLGSNGTITVAPTTTATTTTTPTTTTTTTTPTTTTTTVATCTSDTSCTATQFCNNASPRACVAKLASGASCTAANQCTTGLTCNSGTCGIAPATINLAGTWNITSATNCIPPLGVGQTALTLPTASVSSGPYNATGLSGSNQISISNASGSTCIANVGTAPPHPQCGSCALNGTGTTGSTLTIGGCAFTSPACSMTLTKP